MADNRSAHLERIADQLGMTFREEDRWGLHSLLRDFHLFRQGRWRQITNMLYRSDPMLQTEFYLFDYKFRRGKGRAGDHRQTVFFAHSRLLALPVFSMRPEGLFEKIGQLIGIEDIDFEEFPEFSRQYYLRGDDPDYIRASMNDRVLHYFSREKNWYMEGVNYYLVLYRMNKLLPPGEIRRFFHKSLEIFHMLATEQQERGTDQ